MHLWRLNKCNVIHAHQWSRRLLSPCLTHHILANILSRTTTIQACLIGHIDILLSTALFRACLHILVPEVGIRAPRGWHTLLGIHFIQIIGTSLHIFYAGCTHVEEVSSDALLAGELVGAFDTWELTGFAYLCGLIGAYGTSGWALATICEHIVLASFTVCGIDCTLQTWRLAWLTFLSPLWCIGARRTRTIAVARVCKSSLAC